MGRKGDDDLDLDDDNQGPINTKANEVLPQPRSETCRWLNSEKGRNQQEEVCNQRSKDDHASQSHSFDYRQNNDHRRKFEVVIAALAGHAGGVLLLLLDDGLVFRGGEVFPLSIAD